MAPGPGFVWWSNLSRLRALVGNRFIFVRPDRAQFSGLATMQGTGDCPVRAIGNDARRTARSATATTRCPDWQDIRAGCPQRARAPAGLCRKRSRAYSRALPLRSDQVVSVE